MLGLDLVLEKPIESSKVITEELRLLLLASTLDVEVFYNDFYLL